MNFSCARVYYFEVLNLPHTVDKTSNKGGYMTRIADRSVVFSSV